MTGIRQRGRNLGNGSEARVVAAVLIADKVLAGKPSRPQPSRHPPSTRVARAVER